MQVIKIENIIPHLMFLYEVNMAIIDQKTINKEQIA